MYNKTIQICIFNGDRNGIIMCDLNNWNGRVYKVSRNHIYVFSSRPDASFTGIYLLFGKDEDNKTNVYVGETDNIITRLKQHLSDSFYWTDAVIVVSKDGALNKAHIKYLENRFYCLAKEGNSVVVNNPTIPTKSKLSEYDESMLEEFADNALLMINTLGYRLFDTIDTADEKQKEGELFSITATRGASAKGCVVSDGFVVYKGSVIASTTTPSMSDSLKKYREKLMIDKIIGEDFIFGKDYIFPSPSLAASIVMGRNANGKTEWKNQNGKSINDLETASQIKN